MSKTQMAKNRLAVCAERNLAQVLYDDALRLASRARAGKLPPQVCSDLETHALRRLVALQAARVRLSAMLAS